MNSENQESIVNYLNAGGAVYLESPNIGASHCDTEMFSMFGTEYLNNGGNYEISDLTGCAGTITENLYFPYNVAFQDCHYSVDHLSATSGEVLFQSEEGVARVISSDYRGYRSIISSVLLGCFTDETGNNTKAYLMEQYLLHLDVDYTADGEVCGVILDDDNQEPIEGVIIIVGEFQGTTDEAGFFSIILEDGIYQLSCQHEDYYDLIYAEDIVIIPCETISINIQMISSVGVGDNNISVITALHGNYPNPFNPETTISFSTTEPLENTELIIYNLKGQKVKDLSPILCHPELVEGQGETKYSIVWDGTDQINKPVSSGVYFYRLKTGNYTSTKKMILMK